MTTTKKKIRRPKKGSVHPLALYEGLKERETPRETAALIERFDDEDYESLTPSDYGDIIHELRQQIGDAAMREPKAVSNNDELEGVVVGCVYLGPKKAQRWGLAQQGIQLEEAKRLGDHRKSFKRESVPELYRRGAMTPDGVKAYRELVADVFRDGVAYVDGVEGIEEADRVEAEEKGKEAIEAFKADVVDFLEELGFDEQLRLMTKIIELQSLRRSQSFPSARPRDVGSEAA